MKVLVMDGLAGAAVEILASYPGIEPEARATLGPEELAVAVTECEGLVVRSASKVTPAVIAAGDRLRVIGRAGVGVDNIDRAAAAARGIVVMNVPGANSVSAAELTLALMLALARNVPSAERSLRAGEWRRNDFRGVELQEKTLGLIGLGRIGREVASRSAAFGMRVIGCDPFVDEADLKGVPVRLSTFEEVVAGSDFLSLHVPLSPDTRHLIADESLAKVRKGVRIVNCSRGGVVDEDALERALADGRVAGAALDVYEKEPPGDHPLLRHENVVAVPHIGALTREAQERVGTQIARQVGDFLTGKGAANVVEPPGKGPS
jgi:D-3-phosphoglycerate dehydrogenase